jgi:hypothetical protein
MAAVNAHADEPNRRNIHFSNEYSLSGCGHTVNAPSLAVDAGSCLMSNGSGAQTHYVLSGRQGIADPVGSLER